MLGIGVTKDFVEVANWARRAAEQGEPRGQAVLGFMYAKGIGIEQDNVQAAAWFARRPNTEWPRFISG